jgi:hypothetical protein
MRQSPYRSRRKRSYCVGAAIYAVAAAAAADHVVTVGAVGAPYGGRRLAGDGPSVDLDGTVARPKHQSLQPRMYPELA